MCGIASNKHPKCLGNSTAAPNLYCHVCQFDSISPLANAGQTRRFLSATHSVSFAPSWSVVWNKPRCAQDTLIHRPALRDTRMLIAAAVHPHPLRREPHNRLIDCRNSGNDKQPPRTAPIASILTRDLDATGIGPVLVTGIAED